MNSFGVEAVSGSFRFLSHGSGDFLFAEEDLQQAKFGLELFVFLVFLLLRSTILFLADSVGKHKRLYECNDTTENNKERNSCGDITFSKQDEL